MEKISIGIISNIRKIRLAYRTLINEHPQSPARVVLEGPSIDTISISPSISPQLLLLDYRIVFKDADLFFALTRDHFGNIPILLIADPANIDQTRSCDRFIHSLIAVELDPLQLFSHIRSSVEQYSYHWWTDSIQTSLDNLPVASQYRHMNAIGWHTYISSS